jgi:hypothetical protein
MSVKIARCRTSPDREAPEHYFDWEMLRGQKLPPTRSEFLELSARSNLKPQNVGYAPYAIAEWTERLAIAFAEHRKYPRNRDIQNKCLVYAGFLAHYAEDLCMPLHVTIHHDGMAKPDGSSPRSGIHARIDALPEKLNLRPAALAQGLKVQAPTALMPAIERQIANSRAKIALAYRLEKQLPPERGTWKPTKAVTAFATERSREATRFTAGLMLWAWQESARVKLPEWLNREAVSSTNR